jgi:hypothetical protein
MRETLSVKFTRAAPRVIAATAKTQTSFPNFEEVGSVSWVWTRLKTITFTARPGPERTIRVNGQLAQVTVTRIVTGIAVVRMKRHCPHGGGSS